MRLQQGFSLLEVLVSLLIIKIGLLGILAGQTLALRNVIDATQRTQAVALTNELINNIYSNQQLIPLMTGRITKAAELTTAPNCSADVACSKAELAQQQRFNWYQQWATAAKLPLTEPEFCLASSAAGLAMSVSWQQRLASSPPVAVACELSKGRSGFVLGDG
ncbi:type IV pilus modification protein PilV [Rheinheimera salexigens]|uniref:Type IV pilus modification protein PilV n=1 Tax=Rheinheimera salexigens TaxID=1628148 RepID=A0A1E7Q981_9GAMM|nr:type IV pilus modification protein PilV [Rheinheimera salexigens]OEY70707.1 type IV pilus modification protein PilV [Rheinheimera salexigens]